MGLKRDNKGRFKKGASGNPGGRPIKPISALHRLDGWNSALTGVGTVSHDKRMQTRHCTGVVTTEEAVDLWRGNDIAARIIEIFPNEMLRQGFSFRSDDKDVQEEIESKWSDLNVSEVLWEALVYERAYGGSAVLLGANDGQRDLTKPLNLSRIRSFDWITPLEAREVKPLRWYNDPRAPKFGKPEIYQLNPVSPGGLTESGTTAPLITHTTHVHETRMLIFQGIRVTRRDISELSGWGDSVLTRVFAVLRDFGMSWDAAGILVTDFAQAVFKMKGLAEAIGNDKNEVIKNRLAAVELSRSVARAILIDGDLEEFERKQTPLTGLPDLLDRFATRLAAAADIPSALLFGQSPAGLNATGDGDIRFFYDRVKAMQDRKLKPALERLAEIELALLKTEPEHWAVEFAPLWQPTEKEQAEARNIQAKTDDVYVKNKVLLPEEVTESRFGGDQYSFDTALDPEARAKAEAEPDPEPIQPVPLGEGPTPPVPDNDAEPIDQGE